MKIILVISCYFLGSIPFSYIFSRFLGKVDIRSKGSGNVGVTNVLRTLGIKMALASLAGDLLKGVIAAWLGLHFGGETLGALCAAAAVIGHCWTVFLGFKGGKGIATSAGTLLVLTPTILLILLATFVTIVAVSRFVSLGSVCVAILFPILTIIMNEPLPYILMSFVLAGTVIFRHRTNIDRLRRGVETKINEKAF